MSNFWLKIRVWTKVVVFAVLVIYGLIFVYMNSTRSVQPWFFVGTEPNTSVLLLVFCAFLAGVLATVLVGTTFRTIRQIRDIRERGRSEKLEREVSEMRTKAAMLRSRNEEGNDTAADTSKS